jgi:hypothetical protein
VAPAQARQNKAHIALLSILPFVLHRCSSVRMPVCDKIDKGWAPFSFPLFLNYTIGPLVKSTTIFGRNLR